MIPQQTKNTPFSPSLIILSFLPSHLILHQPLLPLSPFFTLFHTQMTTTTGNKNHQAIPPHVLSSLELWFQLIAQAYKGLTGFNHIQGQGPGQGQGQGLGQGQGAGLGLGLGQGHHTSRDMVSTLRALWIACGDINVMNSACALHRQDTCTIQHMLPTFLPSYLPTYLPSYHPLPFQYYFLSTCSDNNPSSTLSHS